MSLAPGTRIGAYQIVASLGSGGMGEVYRAHDPRLGRDVALKVLPADMAADPSRLERFTREARAIAALNHPHIVTIYSTEEADGIRFLTMELVEGQPLDALMPGSGMPLARFLDFAIPLADALNAAHQKQITHRDLKPANVMVATDGRLKVLDFGLARVGGQHPTNQTIEATRQLLTGEGTIVGTMPYMSPEQVEGKQLDHRTDLFSLGVMFHEMLVGTRPFTGASSPQLMSSILRDTPSSTSDLRVDVPDALSRLIVRCLEKNPDDRVQTARDVYNELRHVQKQLGSGTVRAGGSGGVAVPIADSLWIAVLPFATRGADPDGEALAAGLTEDITAGMSLFPSLSVVAFQSARSFRDSPLDVRQIADRLGARYIISGSVRRAASGTRIVAHLIDARSGTQLWTETYDRGRDQTDIYAIQDDVTDRVVSTIADKTGVLARSMVQAIRGLPLDQLSAHQLAHRCWGAQLSPTPSQHEEVRAALESFLARQPDEPELWAQLAQAYIFEYSLLFNPLPEPLVRARRAAWRAIEIDPSNQEGWVSLGLACFHSHDEAGLQEAVDHVLRLNPRASNAVAWMGNILTHTGAYDRGCHITERAMALNASHAGWYHFAPFNRAFARGDFNEALKSARRVNIAGFHWMHIAIAAAAGHLGLSAEGAAAVEALHTVAPPLADDQNLREMVTRWYWDEEVIESLLEGVQRSKNVAPSADRATERSRPRSSPGTTGPARRPPSSMAATVGTWIAVIPFTSASSDEDSRTLADGLTEDVTAGLARFPYLSVVAEHSARQHKGTTADVRQIGKALGARYILDGGTRRGGASIRITARLVDADSGAQLWSETYTREMQQGNLLAVQDDVTDRVVATVADVHGVLLRTASVNVGGVPLEELTPEELRLRYWSYHRQHAPIEHGLLRDHFERLAEAQPSFAPFWAVLAHLYLHEYGFGFNARPEPLLRARQAVDRALELDSLNQHAWEALAFTLFFEQDREGFAHAADRVLTLNPRNANAMALMGILFVHAGELERGAALADRAMAINPDHPGWYHIARGSADYASGQFESALRAAKRINMPQHLWAHALVAMASVQLGRTAEALAALETLLALEPAFADEAVMAAAARRWKWLPEHAERMVDGYRKAMALRREAAGARPPSDTAVSAAAAGVASAGIGAVAVARQAQTKGLRIAVLPFTSRGGEGAASLAEGLTDDITTGLSRFGYLRVLSRAAASASSGITDGRAAGASLGARYLLEGNVRTAGNALRVTVRLVDTETDSNLWADNIDRDAAAGGFALQDQIASRIVATVGDPTGVLAHSMAMTLADVPLDRLTVAELAVRHNVYRQHLRPEEHARLREAFERALEREPRAAEGWACLAELYSHEHSLGSNPLSDAHDRHRSAAERAVELDPGSQAAWMSLAAVHLFARDGGALRAAVERTVSLNALNADVLANCSIYLSAAGERERAVALIDRAAALKPQHPGWYHFTRYGFHYHRGEYEDALREANLINMPAVPQASLAAAICAGQLGRETEARLALEALRRIDPELLTPAGARRVWSRWNWDEGVLTRQVEGLEKALALVGPTASSAGTRPPSDVHQSTLDMSVSVRPFAVRGGDSEASELAEGLARTTAADAQDAAMRVAVLPFTSRAGDEPAASLADGLTDDITAALSRFSYLRVVSRDQVGAVAREPAAAGKQLGARFLLDGSVRTSGQAVRVSARLVDVESGAHLWAENFDHGLGGGPFAVQDDVSGKIAARVADPSGVLVRSMVASLKDKPDGTVTVFDLTLQFFAHLETFTEEQHAQLRDGLEKALEHAPNNATGWAILADLYAQESALGHNRRPDPVGRQRRAAERAIAIDGTCQYGWLNLASAHYLSGDIAAFQHEAERAISLNPLNTHVLSHIGSGLALSGSWDRGAALIRRALELNPNLPRHIHVIPFLDHYRRGEDEAALADAKKINLPGLHNGHFARAVAAGQLQRREEAQTALDDLRRVKPDMADPMPARTTLSGWLHDGALVDRLIEGLEKALALTRPPSSASSAAVPAVPPAPTKSAASAAPAGPSIAVLPFADLSPERDQAWFCDGVAEEILNALTELRGLRVAARTSAFSFRNRSDAARSIGEALGVGTVLEGSVRRAGDRVRITVQLVDPANGFQLWSERYDRELKDIFEIQDEIARSVAARLKLTLTSAPDGRLVATQTPNIEAYELYMKGRALLYRRGASIQPALDHFRRAVELDPDYAAAWAGIANAYVVCGYFGLARGAEVRRQGMTAARRALALDPQSADALTSLAGLRQICTNDVEGAGSAYREALALNPTHVQALCWYSLFYLQAGLGQFEQGVAEARRAQAEDPLSAYTATILAVALVAAGRSAEGVKEGRKAVAIDEQSFVARWVLGMSLLFANQLDEAESVLEQAAAMSDRHHFAIVNLAMTHARKGEPDRARLLHEELRRRAATGFVPAAQLALSADAAGDRAQALAYARQALEDREPPFILLARNWPDFAALREDPRFVALIRELDSGATNDQ